MHLLWLYSGVAGGGQRGHLPSLFLETCSLYYDQLFAKQITSYFSQRSVVNIDSNEFDKADILSTYFHDDRLNASEVGVAAI